MKKCVRKIIALLMAALLLTGTGVSVVFADQAAVTAVYNAITAESLTNQAQGAITQDLDLPTDVGGISVSWSSSNSSAIDNTGVVSRGLLEEASVTLTATISDGNTANDRVKTFDFVVVPQSVSVKCSENFGYPSLSGQSVVGNLPGWGNASGDTNIDGTITLENGAAAETNYIMSVHRTDNPDWNYITYTFDSSDLPEKQTSIKSRIKFEPLATNTFFDFNFYGKTSGGSEQLLIETRFTYVPGAYYVQSTDKGSITTLYPQDSTNFVRANDWMDIEWEIDLEAGAYNLYVDGKRANYWNNKSGDTLNPLTFSIPNTSLAKIFMGPYRTHTNTTFSLDDFTVTSQLDIGAALAALEPQQRVEAIRDFLAPGLISNEKLFEITGSLNLNPGFSVEDANAAIAWSSSDTSVLSINSAAQTASVTRYPESKTVYLTAEVSAGSATATKTFKLVVLENNTAKISSEDFENYTEVQKGNITLHDKWSWQSAGWQTAYESENNKIYAAIDTSPSASQNGLSAKLHRTQAGTYAYPLKYVVGEGWNTQKRFIIEWDVMFAQAHRYEVQITDDIGLMLATFDYTADRLYLTGRNQTDGSVVTYEAMALPEINEWARIKADINFVSKTYDIYIDGARVNDIPVPFYDMDPLALRYMYFNCGAEFSNSLMYVDNISARGYSDASYASAAAGIANAVKSLGNEILASGTVLPTDAGIADVALVWSGSGVSGNTFNTSELGNVNLTITSISGAASETRQITRTAAPVVVSNILYKNQNGEAVTGAVPNGSIDKVTVVNNNNLSGTLIVSVYEGGKLYSVAAKPLSNEVTVELGLPSSENIQVKSFVWNGISTMKPLSFVK